MRQRMISVSAVCEVALVYMTVLYAYAFAMPLGHVLNWMGWRGKLLPAMHMATPP